MRYWRLRHWIYEEATAIRDNPVSAGMLDAILEYAEELPEEEQLDFLFRMLGHAFTEEEIEDWAD